VTRFAAEWDHSPRTRFGSVKHVYPEPVMKELRDWFSGALAERIPQARVLYWT